MHTLFRGLAALPVLTALLACSGAFSSTAVVWVPRDPVEPPVGDSGGLGWPFETGGPGYGGYGGDVTGSAIDLVTLQPVTDACVTVIDPAPMAQGYPPFVLAGPVPLGPEGSFAFDALGVSSVLGLEVLLTDCSGTCGDGAKWFPTRSHADNFAAYGVTIAFGVSCDDAEEFQASAAIAGVEDDLLATGFLVGLIYDAYPIAGATVRCSGCSKPLYADGNVGDGLFTSGGGVNAATDGSSGLFLIARAPLTNYIADDSVHTFDTQRLGSVLPTGAAEATMFFGF